MPLPHIKKRCIATCRATHEQCKNPAAYGMATCRYHGARKPETVRRGEEHPQYLHGRFAQMTRNKYRDDMRNLHDIQQFVYRSGFGAEQKRRGRPPKDHTLKPQGRSCRTPRSLTPHATAEAPEMDYEKFIHDVIRSRLANPLRSGLYKLVDSRRDIRSWCYEMDRISAFNCGDKRSGIDLRHCTPQDWHVWLRRLDKCILGEVHRNILPGINALEANEVPASIIEEIKQHQVPKIEALVANINALHKIHAKQESIAIRNDSSRLKQIAVALRDILEDILAQLDGYSGFRNSRHE